MKDKKNMTKIILIVGVIICLSTSIIYVLLKSSYAMESVASDIPTNNSKLILECDNNDTMLPNATKMCTLSLDLNDTDVTEVSSVSAKLVLDEKLELTEINIATDSQGTNLWEGSVDNGQIDLYTAENKQDGALIAFFTIKSNGITTTTTSSITINNVIISDQNFDEFKLNDTEFEFTITDNNAALKSLSVDNYSFSPNFDSETTKYNLEVDSNVESIVINGEAQSSFAKIEGIGTKQLNYGKNSFEIIVTAMDGTTTKIYNIEVIRGDILEFESDIIVDNEKKYLTLTLTKSNTPVENLNYTYGDLFKKITTSGIVKDDNGNLINENSNNIITTGSKISIELISGTLYNYTIIILGDTTGEGYIHLNDVTKLFQYYKNVITMDDIYIKAGDVMSNGEIRLNDVAKLFQYIRGTISSLK